MILRRLGNKKKIAQKIIQHFPPHKIFIDVFFGAGGLFFQKPKSKYNIVNDLDSDVFNLFQVIMNQKDELEKAFYMMPIHSDLLNYWKKNLEVDPIKKALRFLLLSNFTYLGKQDLLRYNGGNTSRILYDNIKITHDYLFGVELNNCHFNRFLHSISIEKKDIKNIFIYNDPPYLGTCDTYSNSFIEQDSFDLFEANQATGCKWAMSEFNHPFILEQAKERNLNVIAIGERKNLKNRRTEILVTNYENQQKTIW